MTPYFRLWKMYSLYAVYVIVAAWWAYKGGWSWLTAWLVVIPSLQWLYVRLFPRLSAFLGRASLKDEGPATVARTPAAVTFYRAVGCPFSPIVEQRLLALQERMGFSLRKIDVTLHPGRLSRFGTYSVPVVEVDGWNILGHATTARLCAFISDAFKVQIRRETLMELEATPKRRRSVRPAVVHSPSTARREEVCWQ